MGKGVSVAKTVKSEDRTRLNLELPNTTIQRIEDLCARTEAESKTEVIRRALQTYEALLILSTKGSIILRHENGTEEKILIL